MSGIGEIVGIIACVAGVISAYRDASVIIQKIKKKRAANRVALPSRLLEESVDQAPDEIEREKQRGIARFGSAFEKGDEIAIIALQGVTIELQKRLLEKLRDAAYDDEVQDFMYLVDVTDVQRDRTIGTLHDLKQRLLQARPIVEVGQDRPRLQPARPGISDSQGSTESADSSAGAHQQSKGRRLTEADAIYDGREQQQRRQQQQSASRKTRRNTIFGLLKTQRTKSSTKVEEPDAAPHAQSESQKSLSKKPATSSPPKPTLFPGYKYHDWEDDPQQIWGRPSTSTEHASSNSDVPNTAAARTTTHAHSSFVAKRPTVTMPTPDNDYLGFCKSAWKLQNGDRRAMQKAKEFNDGWSQSSVYYLTCASKCAFASHMDVEKVWDKVWPDEGRRIKFRWPFLAKSHVTQLKVKGHIYAYQCMFCVFQGHKSPVMHGTDLYLEHVHREHCGQLLGEVLLHRTKCITGRIAEDDEDFDINLWPLDDKPLVSRDKSQLLSDSLLDMQVGGSGHGKTSSQGNDSMFQVSASEPWNQGLSDFHWGGELGRTELE